MARRQGVTCAPARTDGPAVAAPALVGARTARKASVGTAGVPGAVRGNKYGNVPTMVGGQRFASKREAARYQALALAERAGRIADLACQVPFDLHAPNGDKVGRYVADFTYRLVAPGLATNGSLFVEDAKGVRTALYRWKKRHTEAEYGIRVLEV